jgi:hypothetical protein
MTTFYWLDGQGQLNQTNADSFSQAATGGDPFGQCMAPYGVCWNWEFLQNFGGTPGWRQVGGYVFGVYPPFEIELYQPGTQNPTYGYTITQVESRLRFRALQPDGSFAVAYTNYESYGFGAPNFPGRKRSMYFVRNPSNYATQEYPGLTLPANKRSYPLGGPYQAEANDRYQLYDYNGAPPDNCGSTGDCATTFVTAGLPNWVLPECPQISTTPPIDCCGECACELLPVASRIHV